MKKLMDKLQRRVTINRKMFLFLFILFIIGLIAGSLFVTILKQSDQTLIKDSIGGFFNSVSKNTFSPEKSLLPAIITQILYVLAIWLLGISIIGVPIVLIIYFSKAFALGFSIGSILFHYKGKGILLALGYVFPHQLLNFFSFYSFINLFSKSIVKTI